MQIIRLKVDDYKCLVDFDIRFNINTDAGSSTILIGENGTGKSTMLKTVLEIMMSFESEAVAKEVRYQYEFEYFYKGSYIKIQQSERHYNIYIDDEHICEGKLKAVKKKLRALGKSIFPERVNYFYSGLNDEAAGFFKQIDTNYKTVCRKDLSSYWNALYLANHSYEGTFPKRKYCYCTEDMAAIYLVSILCGPDTCEKRYLMDYGHLNRIDSVSVMIDTKEIGKRLQNDIIETGNEGVCDLISFIDDNFTDLFHSSFLYQNGEQFFYELRDPTQIGVDSIAFYNFFEKISILLDAKLDVFVMVGESRVNCSNLSEGQRQLTKILGMLGVCKSEDTLVLMDEPDAHMNPKWKYELKQIIDECLVDAINTQAIIATHDPLVINGVAKEYIRIFAHNGNLIADHNWFFTNVIEPNIDTVGMGIDGLLQSGYYGLKTSYDKESTEKFIRRQELYTKLINKEIQEEEKAELKALTKEIGMLPMSYNSIDFLYDDFISVFKKSDLYKKEYLSYDEVLERRKQIQEIISALYEGQV